MALISVQFQRQYIAHYFGDMIRLGKSKSIGLVLF